jgi:hypothetical protein
MEQRRSSSESFDINDEASLSEEDGFEEERR